MTDSSLNIRKIGKNDAEFCAGFSFQISDMGGWSPPKGGGTPSLRVGIAREIRQIDRSQNFFI